MTQIPSSRAGGPILQPPGQVVNVSGWELVDGFGIYPEGSRDKQLLRCPETAPFPFLVPQKKYLLKYSRSRCPHQFWYEVLAYRLGLLAGVTVPQTHCAIDAHGGCAALIEWFVEDEQPISKTLKFRQERKFSGGDLLQAIVPDFEREQGRKHSWSLVNQLFTQHPIAKLVKDWKKTWFEMLAFDAFIGNTDRHQENWVVIAKLWLAEGKPEMKLRLGPFFDNGTGLGYELEEAKLSGYTGQKLEGYVRKGKGHLKWDAEDRKGMKHFEMLARLLGEYPRGKEILERYKGISSEATRQTALDLCDFKVPTPLSRDRAEFMSRLVDLRRQNLIELAHGTP